MTGLIFALIAIGSQPTTAAGTATNSFSSTLANPALIASSQRRRRPRGGAVAASDNSIFSPYAWQSIGPATMGGRVSAITMDATDPRIYFVGFGTGGIFKTTDRGTSFSPVFEHESTASVGSIAVCDAPDNWSGWDKNVSQEDRKKQGTAKIIWVGTGEGNGRNSSSWGDGVFRSTDSGASWTHVGLEDSKDIPAIATDPTNPDTCYVAALGHLWGPNEMRGVFKTTDAGKTWKKVLYVDQNTGAIDVKVDPKNPNVIYAAMYSRLRTTYGFTSGSTTGGIYKSTDGGDHWEKLKGFPDQMGRIGLSICADKPNVVMAIVESNQGGAMDNTSQGSTDNRSRYGGVFRSEDSGKTWTRVNALDPRAFYFSKIYMDPHDSKKVWDIGWDIWESKDGGKTFQTGFSNGLHTDWHALAVDPNNSEHIVAGCDGGLYTSDSNGSTWDHLALMAVGEYYTVAVDRSKPYYRVMGGLQDNGSWLGLGDNPSHTLVNTDWNSVGGGDGFHVQFDPTDPNVIYTESQGGSISRINLADGTYKGINPIPAEGATAYRFNWNTPFIVSQFDPTTLYIGGNRVIELDKRGDENHPISPDLTTNNPVKAATVGSGAETYCTIVSLAESPLKKGNLWSGSDDGLIYHTTDGGQNWANVTPPDVKGLYVAGIEPSHVHADTVYVAVDGHRSDVYDPLLLMSDNAGKTWENITGDLPKGVSTRCIREDLGNPDVLYCGTETGAYVSINRGKNWTRIGGNSLPTISVQDLMIQPDTHDLVAATHGRSLWVLPDTDYISQLTDSLMKEPLHVFDIADAAPQGFHFRSMNEGAHVYAARRRFENGAKFWYWIANAGGVTITIKDSSGKVIRTLNGSGDKGLNEFVWDMKPQDNDSLQNRGEDNVFVPSGTYTVEFAQGDHKETKSFKVGEGVGRFNLLPDHDTRTDRDE